MPGGPREATRRHGVYSRQRQRWLLVQVQVEGKPSEVVQLVLAPTVGQDVPWMLSHRGVARAGPLTIARAVNPSRAVSCSSFFIGLSPFVARRGVSPAKVFQHSLREPFPGRFPLPILLYLVSGGNDAPATPDR